MSAAECPCAAPSALGCPPQAPDACAVVVAGGSGERFGRKGGKQLVEVCGLPLFCWSLIAFDAAPSVGRIVVVCPAERMGDMRSAVGGLSLATRVDFVPSGPTRQDSCAGGLAAVPEGYPIASIHDGARPLVTVDVIERSIAMVRELPVLAGAVCGHPAVDTLKLVGDGIVVATPDRSIYWAAQTPQVFRLEAVRSAYALAAREGYVGTDDSSLVEHAGGRVACFAAPRDNIKVTLPEDLVVAEAVLSARLIGDAGDAAASEGEGERL